MLKTKILLLSSLIPAGAWAASPNADQSRLILQVVCAIVACFVMFVLVLRATERKQHPQPNVLARRFAGSALDRPRVSRLPATLPALLPNPKYLRPFGYALTASHASVVADSKFNPLR